MISFWTSRVWLSKACIEIESGGAATMDAITGFVAMVGFKRTVSTGEDLLESETNKGTG
jgi:hypothetical protein